MPLETSRSIKHVVQQQAFKIDMEVKVTFNPTNKILKQAEEGDEYQASVRVSIADKGFTVTDMMAKGEDFTDMCNRLTKLAIFKLADNLYPSKKVEQVSFKTLKDKK